MIEREFNVTGFTVKAVYTEREAETILLPLLYTLMELRKEKGRRVVVYLAAPPGAGKTTLSLFLEEVYKELDAPYTFQSISMDGFHHYNAYLNQHYIQRRGEDILLRRIKGSPETFDFESLKNKVNKLTKEPFVHWPTYDRALHDVSDKTIKVEADIVLIEGNYLLLNKEPWKELSKYSDYSIFIETDLKNIRERLIQRKQNGGSSYEEAIAHYNRTDKANAELVLTQSSSGDITLYLTEKGRLIET